MRFVDIDDIKDKKVKALVVDNIADLNASCTYFRAQEVNSVDCETTEFEPRDGLLRLVQLSNGRKTVVIDVWHILASVGIFANQFENTFELRAAHGEEIDEIFAPLKEVIEETKVVIHNSKFEQKWLGETFCVRLKVVFDSFLAAQLLDFNKEKDPNRGHKLSMVMRRYVGVDLDKTEQLSDWSVWDLTDEQLKYAALDVYYGNALREAMSQELLNDNLIKVAKLEFDVAPVIARTEVTGIYVDEDMYRGEISTLEKMRDDAEILLQAKVAKEGQPIQGSMFGLPEKNHNHVLLTSSAQMQEAFAERDVPVFSKKDIAQFEAYAKEKKFIEALSVNERILAMKERYPKFNHKMFEKFLKAKKEGKEIIAGTGKKAVKAIANQYDIIKTLEDFRGVDKMVSSFGYNFLEFVKNGRVHPNFYQIGAPTGRFSCNNPNVQQIPDKEVEVNGKVYKLGFRNAFCFPEGRIGVNADYSQIELRVVADMSGDPIIIGVFRDGKDLHADTASRIFEVDYAMCALEGHDYYKRFRKPSKNINFGIVYGIGSFALAGMIDKTPEEAQDMIDKYSKAYPTLWNFLEANAKKAVNTLTAKTLSGRIQRFDPIAKDEDGRLDRKQSGIVGRNGKNMPIQGCLGGDTRILVAGEGYKKIGEVAKQKQMVWDGTKSVGAYVTVSGLKQLCKVRLGNGIKLDCSPEHKFYTHTAKEGYEWTEAKNLRKNHKVFLTEEPFEFDYVDLSCYNYLSKLDSEEIGFLSGVFAVFTDEEGNLSIPVSEYELNRDVKAIFRKAEVFFTAEEVYSSYSSYKEVYEIAGDFREEFSDFEVGERLPEKFWESRTLIHHFLRVLFNFSDIGKESFMLSVPKGENAILWDIQQALLLFGLKSNIVEGLLTSRLTISKIDARRFAYHLGIYETKRLAKGFTAARLKRIKAERYYKHKHTSVISVDITDEYVEMYDVADSDTHQFMANGVITHNTAADILKRALKILDDRLWGLDAQIVNIVHDEVMVECSLDCAEKVRVIVEDSMREAGEEYITKVPIKVDAKIVKSWGEK